MRHLERRPLARAEAGRSRLGSAAATLRLGMLRLAAPRPIDSILVEPLRMSSDIEARP